ncbi:MAG: conserved hypothetical protein (putative transposase or invertase) [Glomeribacter sp. 1016415]|nr:conserved hypothetical protein (putative transposase or invertase) [Glomeribacter sp. 1016415]
MKRSLSIPDDALFKKFMSNVTLAKVFLEVYLPTSVKQNCDFNTLQIANGSFVDAHLRQDFSDIVYTLNIAGAPGYIYAVIEHESAVGRLTPFKLLRYQTAVMQQHLDQGNKLLPVVVPLLFYRGQTSPYPGPLDLLECFENQELAQKIFLKPFTLIDLSIIPDEEIQTHKSIAAFELLQKHLRTRDLLQLAQPLFKMLSTYPPPDELLQSILKYLVKEGRCIDYSQFIQLVTEIAPNYREEIMTLGQQLEQKDYQEDYQKGRRETILEIVSNMLATGMQLDRIKELTKLSNRDLAESISAL